MARYTFGDDLAAVQRLRMVAAAYEPTSRRFLMAEGPMRPAVALDLGCGPGLSTRLLAEVNQPHQLIGIDGSRDFLTVARQEVPAARLEAHDVTVAPLPGAPAQLIYARLLLAHVGNPLRVAQMWRTQLSADGALLIEDLEEIEAPPGPLRHYDEISAEVVREGGGLMYGGPALASLGGRCVRVTVPAAIAAKIYLFNVTLWESDPTPPVDQEVLTQLREQLVALVDQEGSDTVSWIVRQIVVPN